jgi:serine phosphatase RsbU (regulator of sigma subunit)
MKKSPAGGFFFLYCLCLIYKAMTRRTCVSKGIIFCALLLITATTAAQQKVIDSLEKSLPKASHDTTRISILRQLSIASRNISIEKVKVYLDSALALAKRLPEKKWESLCYSMLGVYEKDRGNLPLALEYQLLSLKINEDRKDSASIAINYVDIGVIHKQMEDTEKALEYQLKASAILERIGMESRLAATYGNIGTIYQRKKQLKEALLYYNKVLSISEKTKDSINIARCYFNMGTAYIDNGHPADGLPYIEKAKAIVEQLGDETGMAKVYNRLGMIYTEKKQYAAALDILTRSYALSVKLRSLVLTSESSGALYELYSETGNYKEALRYHEKYIEARDSLVNEQKSKEVARKGMQYEFDKKQEQQRMEQEKRDALAQAEVNHQRLIRNGFIGGFILMLMLALVVYKGYFDKKASNRIILSQKAIVEEKNKQITDSINYAQKIQSAIFLPEEEFRKFLPQSFILLKPKDIVSGDFYWVTRAGKEIIYATADCTGHGVPGGFMSMLGTSLLNEIVNEKGITEPAMILDMLRERVITSLRQSGAAGEARDGMDIMVIKLDPAGLAMTYSGANTPGFIVTNGPSGKELMELAADKQPVGFSYNSQPFTQSTLQLKKGDVIYTFTDGYADQFGGPGGKKFKYRQLKELLLTVSSQPPHRQKETLEHAIESWKGSLEQVDDILVIGTTV